jgi:hypothetical protein
MSTKMCVVVVVDSLSSHLRDMQFFVHFRTILFDIKLVIERPIPDCVSVHHRW